MKNKILQGDALEVLKTLPDESIDCLMTSPPYWALRDYGIVGQLGLEPTIEEYVKKLCDIFDEVKRVLKKTGTCWVNLGDTYGGTGPKNDYISPKYKKGLDNGFKRPNSKLMPKSLCMVPFRFAIEMGNRGWILRNNIIWHKPNAMPSSVDDRFTVDFEYLFFFSKSKKYYFEKQYEKMDFKEVEYRKELRENKLYDVKSPYRNNLPYHKNLNYKGQTLQGIHLKRVVITKEDRDKIRNRGIKEGFHYDKYYNNPLGRNKRAVWRIPTSPFEEAHFATYPEALCEIPIKAGCPEGGLVMDPFFGSGTTGVVALKMNRNFVGIELNSEYIKIAEKRLKPHLEQQKIFSINNYKEVK